MGRVFNEKGNTQASLDYFTEAYEIFRDNYGEDMPEIATFSGGIANAYDKLDNFPNANEWFEKSIRLFIKFFGDDGLRLSVTYRHYAESLEKQGRYNEALVMYTKAYDIQLGFYEPEHKLIENAKNRIIAIKNKIEQE